jgi:integrase
VTVGEARALLDACADDPSPSGARDAALFALLYGVGLRRAEAVALELADYDAETGRLTVRAGKGRKARVVYATNGGRAAVEDWLVVRGPEPGALLCPVNKGGRMTIRHMTAQAAYSALRRRAHTAGVASFTPHDLRRTFAGDLLDDGADLATVQNLMGHANPATTARYDRRGERAKKKAAELRRVPYTPKQ